MRSWAGLVALLALGSPALASDGVLEVNAACVATGCFTGDSPGFPVVVPGNASARLTSDLTVPDANTTAVSLGEAATLDLGGFAISGPTTCTGTPAACSGTGSGIGVSGGTGAVVRNGAIRGMGNRGVSLGENSRAEDLLVEKNGTGGVTGLDGMHVLRCRVIRNGGIGINMNFGDPSAHLVQHNVIYGNSGDGVRSSGAMLDHNMIFENGGFGFSAAFGNGGASYTGNTFRRNNGGDANPQVSGGVQYGGNVCGGDTTCP